MIVNNTSRNEILQSLNKVNKNYDNNLDLFVGDCWIKPIRKVSINRFADTIIAKYRDKIYHVKIGRKEQNPFNPASTYTINYTPSVFNVVIKFPGAYLTRSTPNIEVIISALMAYKLETKFSVKMNILSLEKPGGLLGHDHIRRLRSCCWHAHRDWMIALYNINPDITILTNLIHYKNREHFYETYWDTDPEYILASRCNCEHS